MVIAIIGAGLAGLVAANRLVEAGHDVTVFEKSRGLGGRMATRYPDGDRSVRIDHGASYLSASGPEFKAFLKDLEGKGLVKPWTNKVLYHDGDTLTEVSAVPSGDDLYVATEGMNALGKYLARPVQINLECKVGGITYLGRRRGRKKAWMVNTDTQEVFEADAVIVAVPATQAYGVIQTTQDETSIRRIIREIDEISYDPDLSFMFGYGQREIPDWKVMRVQSPVIDTIVNESSKRDFGGDLNVVVHTTPEFAAQNHLGDREMAMHEVLKTLVGEIGDFAATPAWHQVHFWRYAKARKSIDRPFFENDQPDQPLAVIGDYFGGTDAEAAFNSASKLAAHWIEKYPVPVPV